MSFGDDVGNNDDEGRKGFLQQLVDADDLQGTALGVTKLVIAKGEEALTERQKLVFKKSILDVYVTEICPRHGYPIPWSEMYDFHVDGGRCCYCLREEERIRAA
jgi:hypothetical protein